jgi:Flp pilus assembly protein protease CpaA
MIAMVLLGSILIACAWTDMRRRLIYNAITYPAALIGVVLNCGGSLSYSQSAPSFAIAFFPEGWLGAIGLPQSLVGGAVCFLLMLLVYAGGGAGGGDVKLAAVLGIFLGIPWAIYVLMLTFLIAAATVLPLRVWTAGWRGVVSRGHDAMLEPLSERAKAVPLGVFYALAFFLYLGVERWA